MLEDLNGLDAEECYGVRGFVVDVNKMEDTDAICQICTFLERRGRGTVKQGSSPVYEVVGPPYQSLFTNVYARLVFGKSFYSVYLLNIN